jgi:hypothetical protein
LKFKLQHIILAGGQLKDKTHNFPTNITFANGALGFIQIIENL